MKRLLLSVVLIAVLTASIAVVTAAPTTVNDKTGAFSITVPAGWTLQPADQENNIVLNREANGVVRSSANVGEEQVGSTSLADYEKVSRKNMPKQIPGAKMVSTSKTTLGGLAAYQWIFTAKISGKPFKFKAVFAVKDGTAHILTFTSLASTYQKDISGFDTALKSVKWN
jgi:hypothetical protein